MATKRKGSNSSTNYNFRPTNDFQTRAEAKGTKPLPNPVSVGGALLTALIFGCRKVIFVNTYIKIAVYVAVLFLSFIADMAPLPRSYFSQSSNALNQYFVKLGWAWTLVATVPFVLLTSFTYCCGNRRMIGLHLARIGVATAAWFVFTKSFAYLENNTGQCSVKSEGKFLTKQTCLSAGHFWHSLDISGHAFILIYSALVMIEEARAIVGWETIQDLIRNEEHQRAIKELNLSSPLKDLSKDELGLLKLSFRTFTPYIRGMFVGMTLLVCLWDLMILSTALYFHIMIEKLISGVLAIAVWFITYKLWFGKAKLPPCAVGQGAFQYNKQKHATNGVSVRTPASRPPGPSFMGMPLNTARGDVEEQMLGKGTPKVQRATPSVRIGPITRSQGRPDVA